MENQELLFAMKQLLDSSMEPIRSDLKDIQDRTKWTNVNIVDRKKCA